jgi:hypothetical protein
MKIGAWCAAKLRATLATFVVGALEVMMIVLMLLLFVAIIILSSTKVVG